MNVSEFYAEVLGKKCKGQFRCRWCGSPCSDAHNQFMWPEAAAIKEFCKCPSNHYVCMGCFLYRRQRITLNFMDGTYKDRQAARNHSWIITEKGIVAFNSPSPDLLEFVLQPPVKFAMSIIDKIPNQIQLAAMNDFPEIKANTPLVFTMNGEKIEYTVYELKEAIDHGEQGKEPGVRLLLSLVGELPKKVVNMEKRERGRPVNVEDETTQVKRLVSSKKQK